LGLGPLQSLLSFASARPSLRRPGPFKKEPCRSRTLRVRLSWGSCSRGHNYVGCPFSVTRFLAVAREGRGSPDPRRCRPQGSCPSRRFRLARGSLGIFGPRRSPWPPTLRGLLSCRSRPWSAPPELSLPGEPYPLSRATCFLVGSLSDCRRRSACGRFTAAFPYRASSLPLEPTRRQTRDA